MPKFEDISREVLRNLSDEELLGLHRRLHMVWEQTKPSNRARREDKVICPLCGRSFGMLTTNHLRAKHKLSFKEFRHLFPKFDCWSQKYRRHIVEVASRSKSSEWRRNISLSKKGSKNFWWGKKRPEHSVVMQKYYNNLKKKPSDYVKGKTYEEIYGPEKATKLKKARRISSRQNVLDGLVPICPLSPNSCEQRLIEIFGKKVRFVGDGKFFISLKNGQVRNPDFKVEGQRKLIEFFGSYWHQDTDEEEFIKDYLNVGFDCLVIWEEELQDLDKIEFKFEEFINA